MKLIEDLETLRKTKVNSATSRHRLIERVAHLFFSHHDDLNGITSLQLADIILGRADLVPISKILSPEIPPEKKSKLIQDIFYRTIEGRQ